MRKALPVGAAILVAAVLQVALAPHIAIGGVVPSLLLLVVITLAFAEGSQAGAVAGFAAGLLFDLLGAGPVGAWALVFTLTGYAAGALQTNMFAEGWLLPLTVVFLASALAESSYAIFLTVVGTGEGGFWASVWGRALPGAVYNSVLALLAYPWLARFLRRDRPMQVIKRVDLGGPRGMG